ncbi:phosphomethylpyrimidine synthase ThiC [bacterium]|nr:phosphomethylpyrimidine synthase ThiC [bacterium]
MATQIEHAKNGVITPQMEYVAREEHFSPEQIRQWMASGDMIIPMNVNHMHIIPTGIGEDLLTKVNANIGASQKHPTVEGELEKLDVALKAGTHAVMDLSTGGDLTKIREALLAKTTRPLGTVPIYEYMTQKTGEFDIEEYLQILIRQAQQGVDYFTIHAGVLLEHLPLIRTRLTSVVSRGGAYIANWMHRHHKQNPLYTHFDRILEICHEYDVTISLGDALRPGSIHDATDDAQIAELIVLGKLAQRCRDANVQVMIEGPGHVPLHQIKENLDLKKQYCGKTPFYVLGPLVTDVAPGYDHITGAIGASLAAQYGTAMLCYITPREHLGLPDAKDVHEGVIAFRIAAHAGDLANGKQGQLEWCNELSKARFQFNWGKQLALSIDPPRARQLVDIYTDHDLSVPPCSMCGDFCSMAESQKLVSHGSKADEVSVPDEVDTVRIGRHQDTVKDVARKEREQAEARNKKQKTASEGLVTR